MRLIDADALKEEVNKKKVVGRFNTLLLIDNAPSINPCDNCDLYFKATTKEIDRWYKKEEQKGGADNVMCVPELYQGCLSCDAHNHCFDAFCSNAVNCNAYGKGGAEWQKQQ